MGKANPYPGLRCRFVLEKRLGLESANLGLASGFWSVLCWGGGGVSGSGLIVDLISTSSLPFILAFTASIPPSCSQSILSENK